MAKITAEQKDAFVKTLVRTYGLTVTRKQVMECAAMHGVKEPQWLLNSTVLKAARGIFDLRGYADAKLSPALHAVARALPVPPVEQPAMTASVIPMQQPASSFVQAKRLHTEYDSAVPPLDRDYVAFGYHADLTTIISSKMFYPVFVSGLSGNGKTTMVEQIAARLQREVYRVNISEETDEDALVGGHTLVDGNVVYREGPALIAMKRGAILLLDEVDRGSNKLICLQAILEGKPYMNKKTGEMIYPQPGFTVIATANTKGHGSDDGKFSAARILDEAFLERFAVSIEQQYPENKTERRIVLNNMKRVGAVDTKFADRLVNWAEIIRKTYAEGGIDDVISTRRLVNIVHAFAMFKNQMKAIEMCVNRFDAETRGAFIELYKKLETEPEVAPRPVEVATSDEFQEIV